jgi:RimJ/RimL family protein N-acetyltransferase
LNIWLDPNHHEEVYALVYAPDNKVVGTIGIVHLNKTLKDSKNIIVNKIIDEGKNVYEIGITIAKNYWGKGIGTEALNEMLDYLYEEKKADVVITCHYAENIGSKKIQERNNMRVLGEFQKDKKWFNTDCTTMVVRGKTYEEWVKEKTNELIKN